MTRSSLRITTRAAAGLAACLFAASAGAQGARTVTLDEAVRNTVERSPEVLAARETIAIRSGQLRESKGLFNTRLHLGTSLEHTDQYLAGPSWNYEYKRRAQLFEAHRALAAIRPALARSLAGGSSRLPACPEGFTAIRDATTPGVSRPLCVPVTSDPYAANYGSLNPADFDPSVFFLPPSATMDPLASLDFVRRYAQINGLSIPDFVEDQRQRGVERLEEAYRLITEYEQLTGIWYDRLGYFPSFELNNTLRVTGELTKPFRSGAALRFSAFADGSESRFRGKPWDPGFGGKELPNKFQGRLLLALQQPLLRGRGATTVGAPERAATRGVEAGRLSYAHTVSRQVLDATLAYLDVVAAQQSLALLTESLSTQRRMLDATMRLTAGGEVARVDVTRMQARVADLETSVAEASQALVAARSTLALNAGFRVEDLALDLRAAERFPDTPPAVDLDALAASAVTERFDIRAAQASREGDRILLNAARADTRPRLDLQFRAGYSSIYYSPFFRTVIDEYQRCTGDWADTGATCFEPRQSALNYYSVGGLGRALSDRHWEPEAAVQLRFELPFGNNRALGRVAQSLAVVQRQDVEIGNLERVTAENVTQQVASIRRSREEWLRRREAVEQYIGTWSDTEKRRAAGDMSLIDTLRTEQDLTSARLQLVQAQRNHAAALARLRFETGRLVVMRNDQPTPDLGGLVVAGQ